VIRRATVVAVGRLRGWADEGCSDYLKRLRRSFPVEVVEVPEEDMNRRAPTEVLAAEGERISRRIPANSYVVALDRESGKVVDSKGISSRLASLGLSGNSHVTFVLGGPLGLADDILREAHEAWSLGGITLPHALARVVLLEQLYRATKIERGEKYHW
jgi:23S rRNA (pseudouridine1915-N3)-methyltransferase